MHFFSVFSVSLNTEYIHVFENRNTMIKQCLQLQREPNYSAIFAAKVPGRCRNCQWLNDPRGRIYNFNISFTRLYMHVFSEMVH